MSKLKKIRARISSAHVIAMLALFVALSGSSYAAVTIRASQIRNNSIPGSKLKANSIPASKLKNNSITGRKLRNNTITRSNLRSDVLSLTGGGNVGAQGDEESSSGATGPRGPQGPSGPRGLTGAPGPTGPAGQNGAAGANGTDSNLVTVTGGAAVPEGGTEATASVTCATGNVIYSVYYVTPATEALATTSPTEYTVTITAGVGTRVDIYGLCAPGS
jgi:hypothetical protein